MRRKLFHLYLSILLLWTIIASSSLWIFHTKTNTLLTAVSSDGSRVAGDFAVFYSAGKLAAAGKPFEAYQPELLSENIHASFLPMKVTGLHQMQYPPHFLFLFSLISQLSMDQAWCVWSLGGILAALASTVIISIDEEPQRRFTTAAYLWILLMASFPAWICFRMGQFSFLFLLALTLFQYFLKHEKPIFSALSVGLIKLQYAPAAAIVGLCFKKSSFLLGLVLTAILILGLSILMMGWDGLLAAPSAILRHQTNDHYAGAIPGIMQNFRGICVAVAGQDTVAIQITALIAWILSFVGIATLWLKFYPKLKQHNNFAFDICISISVFLMLLFSINTYAYDYIAALIPCFSLYKWAAAVETLQQKYEHQLAKTIQCLIIPMPIYTWIASPLLFTGNPAQFALPPLAIWNISLLILVFLKIKARPSIQ